MAGYDDPRYVQQEVEKLKREVADLKSKSVPFLAHQRGAVPGMMRAVTIGDTTLNSSMFLQLNGNAPGKAPYQAVRDAGGVIRAEIGNLAANGISPAQFGFRANDGSGTPIFDSLGLISVMKVLASTLTGPTQNFTTTSWVTLTNSVATFTLSRQTNVKIEAVIEGNSVTNNGQCVAFVDGVIDPGPGLIATWGVGGPTVTSPYLSFDTLAAGSHTIDLRCSLTGTPGTFSVTGYTLVVYQLGA